jgi:hypothetical protein
MNFQSPVFQVHSIAPDMLRSESAIRQALAKVEAGLASPDIEAVIDNLLSVSNLLEYIISGKYSCSFFVTHYSKI